MKISPMLLNAGLVMMILDDRRRDSTHRKHGRQYYIEGTFPWSPPQPFERGRIDPAFLLITREGACRSHDPSIFFPEGHGKPEQLARAREVCTDCPVFGPCLTYALDHPELEGVWAGTTEAHRNHIRKQDGID